MFSKEDFDDWKIRMKAHLAALDDDMWFVISDGPIKIMKINTAAAISEGASQMTEKPRYEWTSEDKKKANLDNVAKDILYKTLDKHTFSKIKMCDSAKEIWEKLIQICEGNDQTKENKLSVAVQKFENFKMKAGENLTEFDERFTGIINELSILGREYSNRDIAMKVMRALPKEWDVKTIAMRESKDLNKLQLCDLFADLKAYEFELEIRSSEEPSTSQVSQAFTASTPTTTASPTVVNPVTKNNSEKTAVQISDDAMSLFVRKFSKFMKRNHRSYQNPDRSFKRESSPSEATCFNCGKTGHFVANCPRPKKEDPKRKYPYNGKVRRDRKAMVAEQSKWAESSSESSDDEYSSGSEEVHCLMADDNLTDNFSQVFNFESTEFSHDELVCALNDMVIEYSKLSKLFEEVKAENKGLTDLSINSNCCKDLKAEVVKLQTENKIIQVEHQKMTLLIEAWNKSSVSLEKMQELQKKSGDRTGLGFINNECPSEPNAKPKPEICKEKYINFVKSSKAYILDEPEVKIKEPVNQKVGGRYCGLGYVAPEKKVQKETEPSRFPAASTSTRVKQYLYHNAGPVQKRYRIDDKSRRRRPNNEKYFSRRNDPSSRNSYIRRNYSFRRDHSSSNNFIYSSERIQSIKPIKIIQVWIPKGLINLGPK